MKKNVKNLMRGFIFLYFIFSCISCHHYTEESKGQFLFFEGMNNKEALLSKIVISKLGKKTLIPLQRIFTNTKIILPPGPYLLSNDCTSYEFQQDENKPKRIFLSHMQLHLLGQKEVASEIQDPNQVVQSICYNVLNQKEYSNDDKLEFDILPGHNSIFISGKNLNFDIQPDTFDNLDYSLSSLSLNSNSQNSNSSHFFVVAKNPLNDPKKKVVSAPINGKIWLFPGEYLAEINGTKKSIQLSKNSEVKVQLGLIKVKSPKNFPFDQRMQRGGQPISAYIDDKVLIGLNISYPVFAGKYVVNLDGSELDKDVQVEENQLTEVKTVGSQINTLSCSDKVTNCYLPSRITIHENKQPFILMVVPVGQPFLVFEGDSYQYGVEGVKGLFKALPTSTDSVKTETLGLVNLKWDILYTNTNNTTDFVRFESKSSNLFGKSVDLSFFRPAEVYLPEGDYWLTYFVGDNSNQNAPKTKVEVNLTFGGIKNITIPLYIHASKETQSEKNYRTNTQTSTTTLTPIKK